LRLKPFCKRLYRVKSGIITALVLLLLNLSCHKQDTSGSGTEKVGKTLTILTLDEIKSSGFLKRIIPSFEQEYNCKVILNTSANSAELTELIRDEKELRKTDLVLGLNNCFLTADEDFENFARSTVLNRHPISKTLLFDSGNRVIPYGFGYLAMLYNEQMITQPPESFGELQDARFLNQLAICNPHYSGIGRATMFWTIALFGNNGFQQFWKSIKKNIHGVKDSFKEALNQLNMQQCGMTFGFTSTPAWIQENKITAVPVRSSFMQEGSFLYLEGAVITGKSKNKQLANEFLIHLLSPQNQKFVAYDLGLFPANESTPLSEGFLAGPFTTNSVNYKLISENPAESISSWLEFWDRLFSGISLDWH